MPDSWDFSQKRERPMPPVMTYALTLVCVVVTAAALTKRNDDGSLWYQLGHLGVVPVETLWRGHYAALFTSVFLHANPLHILFNMLMFVRLGSSMEETMNPVSYALFIISSSIVASGAEVALSSELGVGMSGVVYAMCGFMWAGRDAVPAWKQVITRSTLIWFVVWGVLCIVATWTHLMRIANAAHFGGLIFGLAAGNLIYVKRHRPLWGFAAGLMVAITIVGVTWMPWSARWTLFKGNSEAEAGNYQTAVAWYERSMRLGGDTAVLLNDIYAAWSQVAQNAIDRNDSATLDVAAKAIGKVSDRIRRAQQEEANRASNGTSTGTETTLPFGWRRSQP